MPETAGVLYIVATPIGNLGDMTQRARDVLNSVTLIAAEDTRNSQKLLSHFGIQNRMMSLHEHNERDRSDEIINRLQNGESIALISDAGTPLISDPGYQLVSRTQQAGIRVVPIPGASALTAALSVAGIATDRFCFEGFLPSKSTARNKLLEQLKDETRSMVFYEAPHRLLESLESMQAVFGSERVITMAREITKLHETIKQSSIAELLSWIQQDPDQLKGECVLIVAGAESTKPSEKVELEIDALLQQLMTRLSLKDSAQIAAEITGHKKNALYNRALELQQK